MSKYNTVFVGLDVHKDSITAAFVGSYTDEPVIDANTIGTQQYAIDRLCKKPAGRGPLRVVYEAGPCGFWLQRYLNDKGITCLMAAPSLIPKKSGDRIKTDRRDARNLALALRAGTLSYVHVPTHDLPRFPHPKLMAWLGLVPGEHSSGPSRKRGPITRCGNLYARTLLTEAAWAYRYAPKVSRIIEVRAQDIDPDVRAIAWNAQLRLHHVFKKLTRKGKHANVAVTAVARELSAFIWNAANVVARKT